MHFIALHTAKLIRLEDFRLWFETGIQHILDWDALDHIFYIIAVSIPFVPKNARQLVLVVTGFTLGHSLTLALSTIDFLNVPSAGVELAIALTIMISCIMNVRDLKTHHLNIKMRYLTASIFGCIHGLGFSFLLKSMLGKETSILLPLFSFNLGLECGQLIILTAVLSFNALILKINKNFHQKSTTTISFVILAFALYYLVQRTILIYTNA